MFIVWHAVDFRNENPYRLSDCVPNFLRIQLRTAKARIYFKIRVDRPKSAEMKFLSSFRLSQRPREDCHARGDSVVNFVDDDGLRAVGDLGG
jgi:hypothetical protein